MKKKLLAVLPLVIVFFNSCKKSTDVNTGVVTQGTGTANVVVPKDFNWENSNKINLAVKATDTRFQQMIHGISIYDGDP